MPPPESTGPSAAMPTPPSAALSAVDPAAPPAVDLAVTLGRLRLPNPILVASGTFGYGREMTGFLDLARLGGIVP